MITLAGHILDDNMYLSGLQTAKHVIVQQSRNLDGESGLTVKRISGGRVLVLGTQESSSIQGIWKQVDIDKVETIEKLGNSVILNYKGDSYKVVVVQKNFTPFQINEPEGSCKRFTGTITMIEE